MPAVAALGLGLAAGGLSATVFASAYFVEGAGPLLFFAWYVTPLPLLVCGLSFGSTVIALGGAAGVAGVGITAGALAGASFAALHVVPALWVVLRSTEKTPSLYGGDDTGRILSELAAYAAFAFLVVLFFRGFDITAVTDEVQKTIEAAFGEASHLADNASFVESFSRFFPGLFGAWWLVMISVNSMIAQALASVAGRARRATPVWSELSTPRWLPVAFLAAAATASLFEASFALIGATLAMILGLPLLFQGLAVIHAMSRSWPFRRVLLFACYACLLVWPLTPVALTFLAALGTIDHMGRFRTVSAAPS